MPSKKKKYNARFPPARIKKIMQSDEEVGKVAQAVPVIISRALELFVESLLRKAELVTHQRNAKTLTPSHLKQCIMSEQRFDFLRDFVSTISDVQGDEENAELTPRAASSSDSSFVFQQQPAPATTTHVAHGGPGPSTSATSSSSSEPYAADMSEFMMSLPNYLKHDINKSKDEQTYTQQQHPVPSSISLAPDSLSTMSTSTSSSSSSSHYQSSVIHHHQQQQHSSSILNPPEANSNPYIPSSQTSSSLQEHVNSYSHYYSQYDQSANGKLKIDVPVSSSQHSAGGTLNSSSYPGHPSEHYYDKNNEGYHHNY